MFRGRDAASKRPTSFNNPRMQMAAFIVGTLALEEVIILDMNDETSADNYALAIEIVADLLERLGLVPEGGDCVSWRDVIAPPKT